MESVDKLVIGDRIRISVALIREWMELPEYASPVCSVIDLQRERDGTIILTLRLADRDGEGTRRQ